MKERCRFISGGVKGGDFVSVFLVSGYGVRVVTGDAFDC